ncbi:MAG: ferrochelatase [Chloroflexota bacterium]|nr:ferrochelatase [Chloroflexota bacterium]
MISEDKRAVILMAFGGVDSLDDVPMFLENIAGGRKPSLEAVEEAKERYRLIGGSSPLKKITLRQAEALQLRLNERAERTYKVYVGMRYWHPHIKEVLCQIHKEGSSRVTAVIMAPQRSGYTVRGYQAELDSGVTELRPGLEVTLAMDWHIHHSYLEAVADGIIEGLQSFDSAEETSVLFTAHSLPLRFLEPEDPYTRQMEESIAGIVGITGPLNWELAYQSKGRLPGDWLEPDASAVIERLPKQGIKNVLVVPLGFVADHVETLYDIDIVYKGEAESIGLGFKRTPSLNDSPKFIEALADVVLGEHIGDSNQ